MSYGCSCRAQGRVTRDNCGQPDAGICLPIPGAASCNACFTDAFNRFSPRYRVGCVKTQNHVAGGCHRSRVFLLLVEPLFGFLQLSLKKPGLC